MDEMLVCPGCKVQIGREHEADWSSMEFYGLCVDCQEGDQSDADDVFD